MLLQEENIITKVKKVELDLMEELMASAVMEKVVTSLLVELQLHFSDQTETQILVVVVLVIKRNLIHQTLLQMDKPILVVVEVQEVLVALV